VSGVPASMKHDFITGRNKLWWWNHNKVQLKSTVFWDVTLCCRIWGFHSGGHEECHLLGYDAEGSQEASPTWQQIWVHEATQVHIHSPPPMSQLATSAPSYLAACLEFSPLLGRSLPATLLRFFPSFLDQQPTLFRAMYPSSCLLLARWFSQWVLTVSVCHTDEPMGTKFQSSTYLLFPI
jgi:hypothetical protein